MWPGCMTCGAPVTHEKAVYCGGNICAGKAKPVGVSVHTPHTKKKLTRQMIVDRRKKGRR